MSDGLSISRETQEESNPNESIIENVETFYALNDKKAGDGIAVVSSTDNNNNKKHIKLHEMGEQLEIAENRCNTLKTQLDAMKQIYNSVQERSQESARPAQKHIRRHSHSGSRVKNILISSTAKLIRSGSKCVEDSAGDCKPDNADQYVPSNRLPRQNSIAIGTDNTDEAVNTINNILNGITTSVNRLSELHASIENDKRPPTPNVGMKMQADITTDNAIAFDDRATGVDMVKVTVRVPQSTVLLEKTPSKKFSSTNNSNSTENEKRQRKRSQSRSSAVPKNSTNDIILSNKLSSKSSKASTVKTMNKHSQKRIKLTNSEEVPIQETKSTTNTALKNKKSLKRLKQTSRSKMPDAKTAKQTREKNLVELYHNVAAKAGSDSEDSQRNQPLRVTAASNPPISVECATLVTDLDPERLSPIAENGFSELQQLASVEQHDRIMYNEYGHPNNSYQSRSYQLPTIASKLKQVAKSYIHQFNFRTIPFCVATSTSPSHNIGVNIQQVMNILKNRQSFNGISPTLAHNIGIAAEKLHTAPYGEMASSLSSKIMYGKSQCPLKQTVNYQQMQEMAKDVLEEQYTSETPGYIDHNINNQSQNTENDVSENTVWTMDPTKSNCTCVNSSGIAFQQVSSRNQYSSSISSNRDMRRFIKPYPRNHPVNRQIQNWGEVVKQNVSTSIIKEKNLKCVLTNLHDEFDGLNKSYDLLSKRINTGELFGDKEALAELEHLEKQLSDKEEEIKIVMALYKEVVALKNQVRDLKQKASQASMYLQQQLQHHQMSQTASQQPAQQNQWQQFGPQPNQGAYPQGYYQTPSRRASTRTRDNRECKDPMAALHLTKLLKQIQTYQEFYKNGR